MNAYQVLVVGASGKGKTYACRNLDRRSTGVLNVEDKPLPFKEDFEYHIRPYTTAQVKECFKALVENDEVKVIFFDSFSAYLDLLVRECRATKKG